MIRYLLYVTIDTNIFDSTGYDLGDNGTLGQLYSYVQSGKIKIVLSNIVIREAYKPKTYTKQEIDVKTEPSNSVIPIPDILFEAILEERQKYEKNRKRRINDKNI